MSQLQDEVLNRIKQDIQMKTNNQEENLLNTRLQQSVDELNVNFWMFFDPSIIDFVFFFFLVNYERLC
jgi:hypothetical protein